MAALRTGWIGVDLGTRAVKIAQVERRGGRLRLRDAVVVPRRAPWLADNLHEAPPQSSSDDIRGGLLLGNRFSGRRAACLLTMQLCQTHGLSVPAGSPRDRRRLIAKELGAITGRAADEFEFDFWEPSLGAGQPGRHPEVNVLSVSRNWATRAGNDVLRAGLRCGVMDAAPFALSRAAAMMAGGEETVAALDWGYRTATFCLVQRGSPVYVRSIRQAGLAKVIELLGATLDISSDEAVAVLSRHGLPNAARDEVSEIQRAVEQVVAEKLAGLVDELVRTLSFLKSQRNPIVPERIWLFGGGAAVRHVGPFLALRVGLPVAAWQLPGAVDAAKPKIDCPLAILGPAMALSALAWRNQ